MHKLEKSPIKFETHGMKITTISDNEKFGGQNFLIFETNYPNFFIKVYHSKKEIFNVLMKNSNIESVKMLLSKNCFPVKILNETHIGEHNFWALLIESYVLNFKEIVENSYQSHEFDVLKFFMQVGQYLEVCSLLDIILIQLDDENVVMDRDGNFQLANINDNVQIIGDGPDGKLYLEERLKFIKKQKASNPAAPEVVLTSTIGIKSMIWDLGVLAHKAFTGKAPKAVYKSSQVYTDLELPHNCSSSRKLIASLINSCLEMDPAKRIGISELLTITRNGLNEMNLFLININNSILSEAIREDNKEVKAIIEGLGDLVSSDSVRRDTTLNDCIFQSVIYENKNRSLKKTIKILLSPRELIHNAMMKELMKQAWDSPITIVKLYNFLKSRIDELVQNDIKTMKVLLLLHTFIFKGSQNTLIVFLKDGTDQNSVNLILEIILKAFSNRRHNLIFRYAYFIYAKFNLQLKLIKIVQNNFSVTKKHLVHRYEKLLAPEVFLTLFDFLKFTHAMMLSLRKFSFDYFYKNFIVSLYRELIALLGLLSNMTIYLLFGVMLLENKGNAISGKHSKIVYKLLDEFLEMFDSLAVSMNIYVEQVRRLGFENFKFFKIKKNLPEMFEQVRVQIKKAMKSGMEMSSSYFVNNCLNVLFRMNEVVGEEGVDTEPCKEGKGVNIGEAFKKIFSKFVGSESEFQQLTLDIAKLVPNSRLWYEQNMKLITKGMSTNQDNLATNLIRSPIMHSKIHNHDGNARCVYTQTAPFKESEETNVVTIEEIENNKRKVNQKMEIAERGVSLTKNEDSDSKELIINGLNVKQFMFDEFKRSMDAWFIDFNELEIGVLIASGSTCQVHKGSYKNMSVAIKKLQAPGSEKGVEFMKEFKRELSLLISLPHHPNLLTLIGFCLDASHIYLVTEFCEGGSLFDILHRKHLDVQITFKQKIKILLDVARGMQFLHQLKRQIIHRDLKSLNILIDKRIKDDSLHFQAKIADFGLARSFENPGEFSTKGVGTPHWMAPEIFSNDPYTTKTDVYAFAIIIWEIFAHKTPYGNLSNPSQLIKSVVFEHKRPLIDECSFEKGFEEVITTLIEKNWHKEGSRREEFIEIYEILDKIISSI